MSVFCDTNFQLSTILSENAVKDYIEERVLQMAQYVVEKKCTVRQAAAVFCVSKSTAHKDLSERLPLLNKCLCKKVSAILGENWQERHLRGGMATQRKYRRQK